MSKVIGTCWSIQLKFNSIYEVVDSYGQVINIGKFISRFKVENPLIGNIRLQHVDLYVFKKHGKQQFDTNSVYFGATPNFISKYGNDPVFTVQLEACCYAKTIEGLFAAGFTMIEESIAKAIKKVGV